MTFKVPETHIYSTAENLHFLLGASRGNGMHDHGIIYVASRELRFVCEAIASAETVKALWPDLSLCLFTDTDIAKRFDKGVEPFDEVVPVDQPAHLELSEGEHSAWTQGILTKVRSLANTPYEKTLFLDTDTRVLSREFRRVFDMLDDFEFCAVPCTPQNSRSCSLYGPMFNTGVIGYRRTRNVSNLLTKWVETQLFHLDLAGKTPPGSAPYIPADLDDDSRRFLLATSQLSLARLLSPAYNPLEINVKILGDMWNARKYPASELNGVIVDHAHRHKIRPDEVEAFLLARSIP